MVSPTSAQTSTRSPVSVAGSQLIWYSFSWLLCVSLYHSPQAHTLSEHAHSPYACVTARQTFSAIFYSVYSASARWRCLRQCALYLNCAAAPRRVQPQFLIREFCSFRVWSSPWTDHQQPRAVLVNKGLQSSWVLGHMAHFILGFRFGASGGFGFLSDQSRGSHLICRGSVAEQVLRWTDSRLNHSSLKSIQPFCVWHLISRDLQ